MVHDLNDEFRPEQGFPAIEREAGVRVLSEE